MLGIPQALLGTANDLAAALPCTNGPPNGPAGLRVSAMRQGVTGTKLKPVSVGSTVSVAEAVLPVPPFADVTALVVAVKTPAAEAATGILSWHCPPTARLAPVSAMLFGLVVVNVPPHWLTPPLLVMDNPGGSVSVKAIPDKVTSLPEGLVRLIVRVELVLGATEAGANDWEIVGGATTSIVTEYGPPVPPSFDVAVGMVLVFVPGVVPIMFKKNWQFCPPLKFRLDMLIVLLSNVPVNVNPGGHWPPGPDPVATRPAGKVSVKLMPDRSAVKLPLLTSRNSVNG